MDKNVTILAMDQARTLYFEGKTDEEIQTAIGEEYGLKFDQETLDKIKSGYFFEDLEL